jgi:hypothetical protein
MDDSGAGIDRSRCALGWKLWRGGVLLGGGMNDAIHR